MGVCAVLWVERNNRAFKDGLRGYVVMFDPMLGSVFLLVAKAFCNYSLGLILLDWSLFL